MTTFNHRSRKEKDTHTTILLSECPVEYKKCSIRYYKGKSKVMEMCMCRCHSHARPPIREPDPIVGIEALRDKV